MENGSFECNNKFLKITFKCTHLSEFYGSSHKYKFKKNEINRGDEFHIIWPEKKFEFSSRDSQQIIEIVAIRVTVICLDTTHKHNFCKQQK